MMDAKKVFGFLAAGVLLAASLGAVETIAQRRQRVAEMSAEQRDDLFRNEQQFRALSPQEQQRIRDLHDQIESAPDREKLRATMNRYCKWFEAQPPFRRAKLLDKKRPLDERIKTVKEFVLKQGPSSDLHLDDKNRRVLATWLDRYTADNGPRFLGNMAQGSHPGITALPPERQKAVLREWLLRRWQTSGPGGPMPTIAETEMARLRAGLSPDLRSKLEAKKPGEQAQIIAGWIRETASRELDEELAGFFENSIGDEERDRLMSLPGDDMYKSLSEQYRSHVLKQTKPGEPPRHNDHSPRPHGHRNGPPWATAGRYRPDEPGPGKGTQSNTVAAAPKSTLEVPPAEKHDAGKTSAEKAPEKAAEKPVAKQPHAEPWKEE